MAVGPWLCSSALCCGRSLQRHSVLGNRGRWGPYGRAPTPKAPCMASATTVGRGAAGARGAPARCPGPGGTVVHVAFPGGCHPLCTPPGVRAGTQRGTALPFMSEPPETTASPHCRAGIKCGSYLIKVGRGEGSATLRHPGVGEAGAGRECENLGASGGRGENISVRGLNGPVPVGTLLPTARRVRAVCLHALSR